MTGLRGNVKKMVAFSISNCFSYIYLSLAPQLNTSCHNEGPPLLVVLMAPMLAHPVPVANLLLPCLTSVMALTLPLTACMIVYFIVLLPLSLLYLFLSFCLLTFAFYLYHVMLFV